MKKTAFAALFASVLLSSWAAFAQGPSPEASFTELRDRERMVEEKRQRELNRLEAGVSAGNHNPDQASEMRFRIEQGYRRDMEGLTRQREDLMMGADLRKPASGRGAGALPRENPALPSIPSQSVISYPGASPDQEPPRDGSQKNVGVGVRELKF